MSTATPRIAIATRWSRDLAFHLAGVLTACLGLTLWTVGVALSLSLAITYFGLVVALGTLLACRWFARVERRRAAVVLGAPIAERHVPAAQGRRTARLHALIGDATTWRDFAWTGLAGSVGMTLSVLALTLWGCVLAFVTLPAWFWALPGGADVGVTEVDTLRPALIAALLGLALVPLAGRLVRGLTVLEIAWMQWLLAPRRGAAAPGADVATAAGEDAPAARARRARRPAARAAAAAAAAHLLLVADRARHGDRLGGHGVGLLLAGLGLARPRDRGRAARRRAARGRRARRRRADAARQGRAVRAVIAAICWVVWALAGGGYLWPVWPMLGMGTGLALRAILVFRDRLPWAREHALAERVDVLTRTRQGALDVQAAELRRIERDLHDGAQARLVALTMQLGRAEERVADQPEVAALLRRAREDAGLAIAELRDLARGIAPPILTDRGLAAAIEALGRRSPISVSVEVGLDADRRPLPVVETAAYFVVAEALTNVAKHARGAAARVGVHRSGDRLVVEVADDGPGGADVAGGGLQGLRHRVEALDGTLTVTSPVGEGTTVRAELPCAP